MTPAPVHDSLLLFGATGDLSQRYLFPSLVHLLRDRLLPPTFRLIAIGRQEFDAPGFAAWMRESMRGEHERWRDAFEDLIARTTYVAVDLADPEAMAARLHAFADRPAVSYRAFPPVLFEPTCRGLQAAAGRLEQHRRKGPVADRGTVGECMQSRRHRLGIRQVHRHVGGARDQVLEGVAPAFVLAAHALPHPGGEARRIELLAPDRDESEGGRQQPIPQQVHQRRKQIALRQVAGGAEQQQRVMHRGGSHQFTT